MVTVIDRDVRALIAEARQAAQTQVWVNHSDNLLGRLADALEAAAPSSDDTEWEYGREATEDEGYESGAFWLIDTPSVRVGDTTHRRRKAGPWVAIEKGGEGAQ